MLKNYTAVVRAMPVIKLMAFKSAIRTNSGSSLRLRVAQPSEGCGVIRQPDRQIAQTSFGRLHSEKYRPIAQVMKRMFDIYKDNE